MLPKKITHNLAAISLICTIVSIGGCFNQQGNQDVSNAKHQQSHVEIDTSLCQFQHKPCEQSLNELLVSLNISPESAPSEKPLQVDLTFSKKVENLTSRIEGRDMFMGVIPVNLVETNKNHYQATTIYGSCSSNYMVWRMFVSFTYQEQLHSLWFDFLADNQPS